MRDFFHPEPGRGKIDKTNVVFADLIDSLANTRPDDGGINTHMRRMEEANESRFHSAAAMAIQRHIDLCELLKAGIREDQYNLNKEYRERARG